MGHLFQTPPGEQCGPAGDQSLAHLAQLDRASNAGSDRDHDEKTLLLWGEAKRKTHGVTIDATNLRGPTEINSKNIT
jgi:hypothetical protein